MSLNLFTNYKRKEETNMTNLFSQYGIKAIAFIDFETTGLKPALDHPTEIGIRKIGVSSLGMPYDRKYEWLLKLPEGVEVPEFITNLTGLTTEKLQNEGEELAYVRSQVQQIIDSETAVVAHNANFDLGFLAHHFQVEPRIFFCTRSIEILNAPHLNASLKNVFPRYAPEQADLVQTHRASDDIEMLIEVFNGQTGVHGNEAMIHFANKIVNMPDREICFKPYNAVVLDFTEKYVAKHAYEKLLEEVESLREDAEKLAKLEAYGVDNWSGYGEALSDSEGIFE
jgi:DNA polymerase III subunit epsilon